MAKLIVDIPEQILPMLGKNEKEICQEILYRVIATLYWQEELSLGKSAELCGYLILTFGIGWLNTKWGSNMIWTIWKKT